MKSWLKKAGELVLKGVQVFLGIQPMLQSVVGPTAGKVLGNITEFAQAALTVEVAFASAFAGQSSGPQKLVALIPLVQQIVVSSEFMVGKKVADEALFTKAMQEYAQATADLLNSIHPDSVKTA